MCLGSRTRQLLHSQASNQAVEHSSVAHNLIPKSHTSHTSHTDTWKHLEASQSTPEFSTLSLFDPVQFSSATTNYAAIFGSTKSYVDRFASKQALLMHTVHCSSELHRFGKPDGSTIATVLITNCGEVPETGTTQHF